MNGMFTVWRHVKTDSLYLVLGEATCSTNGPDDGKARVVVYFSLKYQRWFYRDAIEFCDGRFERVEAPPWPGKPSAPPSGGEVKACAAVEPVTGHRCTGRSGLHDEIDEDGKGDCERGSHLCDGDGAEDDRECSDGWLTPPHPKATHRLDGQPLAVRRTPPLTPADRQALTTGIAGIRKVVGGDMTAAEARASGRDHVVGWLAEWQRGMGQRCTVARRPPALENA